MKADYCIPRFWLIIEAIGAVLILAAIVITNKTHLDHRVAILSLIIGVIFMIPALIILFCNIARKLAADLLNRHKKDHHL